MMAIDILTWLTVAMAALMGVVAVLMAVFRVGFVDQRTSFRDFREGARVLAGCFFIFVAGVLLGNLLTQ